MRAFSSAPHQTFIALRFDGSVQLVRIPRVTLALVVAAVLACGLVLGGMAVSLRSVAPVQSPAADSPPVSPASPSSTLPSEDVTGEDLERLPRYPGSVRSAHEIVREDRFTLTASEYRASASVDDVRTFYQGVIVEHGWERADINFDHGEWSYVLVDGSVEALIEIEEFGGLVEIDLQVSEPLATPTEPQPTLVPTVAPTSAPPPPPPPPPPPGDDDDDDDDSGDDGSDDG